jgi:hypothetical protein
VSQSSAFELFEGWEEKLKWHKCKKAMRGVLLGLLIKNIDAAEITFFNGYVFTFQPT